MAGLRTYTDPADAAPGHVAKLLRIRGGQRVYRDWPLEGAAKIAAAEARLPKTDAWGFRSIEDRIAMPDDRVAYRVALRRIQAGEDIPWPPEPAPFSPAPQVPKRIVQERLAAKGKFGVGALALMSDAEALLLWLTQGDFNVETADPMARTWIEGMGEDPDEILAPTIGV